MATGKINPPMICPNGKGTGFDVRYKEFLKMDAVEPESLKN